MKRARVHLVNRGIHHSCMEHSVNWNYQVSVVYNGIFSVSRVRWTLQGLMWNG